MSNYVTGLSTMASVSLNCPGDGLLCLALAVVGIVCVAWGLGLMGGGHPGVVRVRH